VKDGKLGIAILGTGWVSNEHIKAFQRNPRADVVAILSRSEARAEAKAREHGLENCRAYTSLADLLQDSRVDAVSVCTPHHLHAEQGIQAAESGRHILVEKPIALDCSSLHQLNAAVERAGVRSVVSFVLRWNPLFENIKSMLAENWIGSLGYAEVDYMHGIEPSYTGYEWIRRKQYGGNNLLTGGCHAVDALRWFAGSEVAEVFGYAATGKHNRLGYEYETNSVTVLKFANGMIAKVGCSIECVMPYVFNILLLGEEGSIRNNQVFSKRWPGQTGWATIPTILPDTAEVSHHPFAGEVDHFIDCILEKRESHCNVADAVKTHEICIASEISAKENRPVRLPL
jgi:predicted dehydrogenase